MYKCQLKKNCCNSFAYIDDPILSREEKDEIISSFKVSEDNFIKHNNSFYTIKTQKGICPFLNENNRCSIYKCRPNDCKLFPFDIKRLEGKYYLVRYNFDCCKDSSLDNVDDIVEKIESYKDEFVDKALNKKMENISYETIKEVFL